MFAAALVYSCPNLECSIYSTCKRISQKLLRNIYKFLELIYAELGVPHYRIIRYNMEEIVLKGPESDTDVRIVNSYPSKVCTMPVKVYVEYVQAIHMYKHVVLCWRFFVGDSLLEVLCWKFFVESSLLANFQNLVTLLHLGFSHSTKTSFRT
jgi:hypothetical protein